MTDRLLSQTTAAFPDSENGRASMSGALALRREALRPALSVVPAMIERRYEA